MLKPYTGFPGGSDGQESACKVGDLAYIAGSGRPPGGRHGNPLQYSCLENPMDRAAWWATVHGGHKELDMTERLSTVQYTLHYDPAYTHTHIYKTSFTKQHLPVQFNWMLSVLFCSIPLNFIFYSTQLYYISCSFITL
ncbi:unnamed protein product [Rangifer tarandus platyrhynchus]|uniref:Uncharacterized protein n=2 Tax=Rangifer tarandus platyrhynchus TaxID=3082113 RepID=A0ABN8ZJ34_RANTA|nr:unnamed protein product [Rangifer tarandus platyrhynchus]